MDFGICGRLLNKAHTHKVNDLFDGMIALCYEMPCMAFYSFDLLKNADFH